ncbi:MBL fold metallo-hydrolase [Caldicellulosiruptoraceae bacterium PP1]
MKITFLGGANEVGASSCIINISNKNILIDSGIRMKEEKLPNLQLLKDYGGVDFALISHAHMDHIGSFPIVAREYPNVLYYATHATKDLIKVLLYDSIKVMDLWEEEIPLYAEKNVENFLDSIVTYSYNFTFEPIEGIKITFFPAGHILGASMIFIQSPEGSLLYTGDFSISKQLTVEKASIPKIKPDVVICESTYGDRIHTNRTFEEERLFLAIQNTIKNGGKVLIPAFAVGRAQEIILILKNFMKKKKEKFNIFIDGMVKDVIRIYERNPNYISSRYSKLLLKGEQVFRGDNVLFIENKNQREKLLSTNEPCVIISSSGMLTGGPSVLYAKSIISNEKNLIAITGYQDEESPGRKLLELTEDLSEKKIEFDGNIYDVKCKVDKFGLSAHADRTEILGLMQVLKPKNIIFVHGQGEAINELSNMAIKELDAFVLIPNNCELNSIQVEKPRKQLTYFNVKRLQKDDHINSSNIYELWQYLVSQGQVGNHITSEHAITIWNGYKEINNDESKRVFDILKETPYFEQNHKRPYLFKILSIQEVEEKTKPKLMEQNTFRNKAIELFEEYGLYKVSFDVANNSATLFFNYPKIAEELMDKIEKLQSESLWDIKINQNINLNYANKEITELCNKYNIVPFKISYNPISQIFLVKIEKENPNLEIIADRFYQKSRIRIEFDYPKQKQEIFIEQNSDKMEQNKALTLIEIEFEDKPHKIYKKSIKNNGQYIEVSFISPQIGNRYLNQIKKLQEKTGWSIEISESINQNEISKIIYEMFNRFNIVLAKNPSFLPHQLKFVAYTTQEIDEDLKRLIEEEFIEKTGLKIDIIKK